MLYFNAPFTNSLTPNYNYTKIPPKELRKLQQLEIVFGTILIEGTNFTSFLLPNLQEIYQVAEFHQNYQYITEAIVLQNNFLLEEIEFPQLRIAFSQVSMYYGNTNLTRDDDLCRRISNGTRRMTLATQGNYDCSEDLKFLVVTTWEYTFRALSGGANYCCNMIEYSAFSQVFQLHKAFKCLFTFYLLLKCYNLYKTI